MFEAVFTCPLRHAAGEIHLVPADFPTFVSKLDDHPDRAGADDSPLTFRDVGNLHNLAVNQSGHGADPDRIADPVDSAAQRRPPMIDLLGRAKHFEIKTRPPLAEEIDRVALV